MADLSTDDARYSYEESLAIINTFRDQLQGQHVTTNRTPRLNTVAGVVDAFLVLPYQPGSHSFDLALFNYTLAASKAEWLAAKRRENHWWIPLVRIGGHYVALVPILVQLQLWNEKWRQ